ncbi:hypothetical protein SAMN05444748_103521 [Variovorax sp. OV700]|nr:hypothetical protein SAMN05444748_103521 [Variovorax sp. OV700]
MGRNNRQASIGHIAREPPPCVDGEPKFLKCPTKPCERNIQSARLLWVVLSRYPRFVGVIAFALAGSSHRKPSKGWNHTDCGLGAEEIAKTAVLWLDRHEIDCQLLQQGFCHHNKRVWRGQADVQLLHRRKEVIVALGRIYVAVVPRVVLQPCEHPLLKGLPVSRLFNGLSFAPGDVDYVQIPALSTPKNATFNPSLLSDCA